ncbi:MAG TPA: rod shape-determining protein RodA [Alphaproteobacteria bacterium]|nr:rod shape-determining protein RodA [Micavibrio sp.]MBK9561762.1 rod shape-determining protein RodA [Micavibrio sp.]HQX26631.1 rod shape-determining protein RodA [Alphaproteobacteria bacterium]
MVKSIILQSEQGIIHKLKNLDWAFIALIVTVACIGFTALYSAAGGNFEPWAENQMQRFSVIFFGMLIIALIDVRWWFKFAWWLYGIGFILLVYVEIMGHIGMGAQRWINLGFMKLQPSELMKVALVLTLARYFHAATSEDIKRLSFLIVPALLIGAPVGLVMLQPDLGTALMTSFAGAAMVFVAGAPLWIFIGAAAAVAGAIPIGWHFMHDYQRQRVLTFLNPESDPLGSGYHITQSKIALGSGGLKGKGFLDGSQSHLDFLPEKQTDFIFTLWAEEWGLAGGVALLLLFGLIIWYGLWIALRARHNFGRYLAFGLTFNFSIYVFVNIAMVMGLIPVVGAPLPLVSYGGTAMLAAMIGFGLILSCNLYRDSKVTRI